MQTSTQKASTKKRRKRKGLAGFFAALGCLSAGEFEEDNEKSSGAGGIAMTQKPGAGAATQSTSVNSAPGPSTNPVSAPLVDQPVRPVDTTGASGITATAATTGPSTLVGAEANQDGGIPEADEVKPEAVILAPIEPVTLPEDEVSSHHPKPHSPRQITWGETRAKADTVQTAGVTSSAVQAPGSGSALLSTPLRPHPARRESDTAIATPASDNERTETSGGYSNISESDAVDESTGQGGEDFPMDEEYEDEEDRLIAQGGIGIPLDEVSDNRCKVWSYRLMRDSMDNLRPCYRSWTECMRERNV